LSGQNIDIDPNEALLCLSADITDPTFRPKDNSELRVDHEVHASFGQNILKTHLSATENEMINQPLDNNQFDPGNLTSSQNNYNRILQRRKYRISGHNLKDGSPDLLNMSNPSVNGHDSMNVSTRRNE
jgi:hypothetical protein